MKGTDGFAVAAGIVMLLGGVILLIISIFFWPLFIYGIILLVIGIVILVTLREQEHIEPIKRSKRNHRFHVYSGKDPNKKK